MNSLDSPFLAQNPDKVAACLPARTQGGRSMGVGSWLAWLGRFGRLDVWSSIDSSYLTLVLDCPFWAWVWIESRF